MQSVMESLCRCFGSTPMSHWDAHDLDSLAQTTQGTTAHHATVPATPHKRTNSLGLRDKQWDALFSHEPFKEPLKHKKETTTSTATTTPPKATYALAAEPTHHSSSKSKQQHASKRRQGRTHKRKRSGSRDDIFRTKKLPDKSQPATLPNPLSRFLSSHPVIAHSLCFATPVKDSNDTDSSKINKEDDDDKNVGASLSTAHSDTNSLNNHSTTDDTMTSTVYYETTKLAGLFQKSPPMPLFTNSCVNERDDIHQILQALQKEHDQQQRQMDDFVSNNNSAHGRLVVYGKPGSIKKDLFGAKHASARPYKSTTGKAAAPMEAVPPVVYSGSSNSSEASKGVVVRHIAKQARQV